MSSDPLALLLGAAGTVLGVTALATKSGAGSGGETCELTPEQVAQLLDSLPITFTKFTSADGGEQLFVESRRNETKGDFLSIAFRDWAPDGKNRITQIYGAGGAMWRDQSFYDAGTAPFGNVYVGPDGIQIYRDDGTTVASIDAVTGLYTVGGDPVAVAKAGLENLAQTTSSWTSSLAAVSINFSPTLSLVRIFGTVSFGSNPSSTDNLLVAAADFPAFLRYQGSNLTEVAWDTTGTVPCPILVGSMGIVFPGSMPANTTVSINTTLVLSN